LLGKTVFNWLFRRADTASGPAEGTVTPDQNLSARLSALEESMRQMQLIRVEWTEVLDKLSAWTNRQNARDAKRLKAGLEKLSESPEDAPETTNATGAGLDPHQLKQALRQRVRAQNGGSR
jgi:hypothetical protein